MSQDGVEIECYVQYIHSVHTYNEKLEEETNQVANSPTRATQSKHADIGIALRFKIPPTCRSNVVGKKRGLSVKLNTTELGGHVYAGSLTPSCSYKE
jgi:hypothetical protein